MAKKRTDKSKYQSPSTGDYCTAAQYITEILITRQAAKKGKKLPHKFWNVQPWKTQFRKQIFWVNGLLKTYSAEAVVAALNSKDGKYIYSTAFPKLDYLIELEQAKIDKLKEDVKTVEINRASEDSSPRQSFGKKTQLSKLRELDG